MVCHYACDRTFWRRCCFISGYGTDQRTWSMGHLEPLHPLYRCRSCGGGRYFQSDQSIAADHTDFCTGSPRLWKKYGRGIQNIAGYPNPCCPCGDFAYRGRDVADPCDTGQFTGSNFNCSLRILFCNRIFQNGRVSRKFE